MRKTVNSLHYQRGLGALGWLLVLVLLAFAATCAIRIVPPYYDNWKVRSTLETLNELKLTDNEFNGASNGQVLSHLSKHFQVSGVPDELLKKIKITRTKGRAYVDINWDIRVPLISNIDVVVTFENQYDSLYPSDCCRPKANTNIDPKSE